MAESKLSKLLPGYAKWIEDVKHPTSKFMGIPVASMSGDDLLAVIGFMNNLLHDAADAKRAMEQGVRGATGSETFSLMRPKFRGGDKKTG